MPKCQYVRCTNIFHIPKVKSSYGKVYNSQRYCTKEHQILQNRLNQYQKYLSKRPIKIKKEIKRKRKKSEKITNFVAINSYLLSYKPMEINSYDSVFLCKQTDWTGLV